MKQESRSQEELYRTSQVDLDVGETESIGQWRSLVAESGRLRCLRYPLQVIVARSDKISISYSYSHTD
jgi:hypothetical protein